MLITSEIIVKTRLVNLPKKQVNPEHRNTGVVSRSVPFNWTNHMWAIINSPGSTPDGNMLTLPSVQYY